MAELYRPTVLELSEGRKTANIDFQHGVFERAVKALYDKGGFSPEMLGDEPARNLTAETFRVLDGAISSSVTQETPEELTNALRNNAFIFSGFKTYHALTEAGVELTDDTGGVKPFDTFARDVQKIDDKYNRSYLYAEYNHAVHTSQMAVKWHDWEQDGDEYNLQYRTAGDERVREAHAKLDGVTLPPSDKFWDLYLPPNGWNCRCNVVQVLKNDYKKSSSDKAVADGDACTSDSKQQIFRYNAGKSLDVFPPKHPYLPKGCGTCTRKKTLILTKQDKSLPVCRACGVVADQCLERQAGQINDWKQQHIDERAGLKLAGGNFKTGAMVCSRRSVRDVLDHSRNIAVRNSLLGIERNALRYQYVGWAECATGTRTNRRTGEKEQYRKHPEAAFFLYYEVEIGGKKYYANVKAHRHYKCEVLYCIRERCNVAALRHDEPPRVDEW